MVRLPYTDATRGSNCYAVISTNQDEGNADFLAGTLPATPFNSIISGRVVFSPPTGGHTNADVFIFLIGNIQLVFDHGGGDITVRFEEQGVANTSFIIDDLFPITTPKTWYELRFYLDWNDIPNSKVWLNNTLATFSTTPTVVATPASVSIVEILRNIEQDYQFAQFLIYLQPNNGTDPDLTLAQFEASIPKTLSFPFETGVPYRLGETGKGSLFKLPAVYINSEQAEIDNQEILNKAHGTLFVNNGVNYTIIDDLNIKLGA